MCSAPIKVEPEMSVHVFAQQLPWDRHLILAGCDSTVIEQSKQLVKPLALEPPVNIPPGLLDPISQLPKVTWAFAYSRIDHQVPKHPITVPTYR